MTDNRIITFRDLLRNGDAAEAIDQFDEFDAAVEQQANRESALRDIARGIIARVQPDAPAHATAQQFLQTVTDAQQARIKAKYDFALYLQGGPSAESVADRVNDVISTTDAVEKTAEQMRNYGSEISLPSVLSLSGPGDITTTAGSTIEETYTVTNVGVSDANNVEVTLDGYELSIEPVSIDSLSPGDSVVLSVSGPASEVTEAPVVVSAGAASTRTGLNILDSNGHLDRALITISDIENHLGALSEGDDKPKKKEKRNGKSKKYNGLKNKINEARKQIEIIQEQIKSTENESVSAELESVRELMGAFINQIHGLGKTHLSDRDEAVLASDATKVIDELAAAAQTVR